MQTSVTKTALNYYPLCLFLYQHHRTHVLVANPNFLGYSTTSRTGSENFQLAGKGVSSKIPPMAQLRAHRDGHRRHAHTSLDGDKKLQRAWTLEKGYKTLFPPPNLL